MHCPRVISITESVSESISTFPFLHKNKTDNVYRMHSDFNATFIFKGEKIE